MKVLAKWGPTDDYMAAAQRCVALSADGRWAAIEEGLGQVALFDGQTGQVVHTLVGHGGAIAALAFSKDNRLLASGTDWEEGPSLILWDVETGEPKLKITEDHFSVSAIDFTHDNRHIAVILGTDEWASLVVCDVATGKRVWEEGFGEEHAQSSIACSPVAPLVLVQRTKRTREHSHPDEERYPTGCVDLWNWETRKLVWRRAAWGPVAFENDGATALLSYRIRNGGAFRVETVTGQNIQGGKSPNQVTPSSHLDQMGGVIRSGRKIERCDKAGTVLWSVTPPSTCVAIAANGTFVATLHQDNEVRVWEKDGRLVRVGQFRRNSPVAEAYNVCAVNSSGRIVQGTIQRTGATELVDDGRPVTEFNVLRSLVPNCAFSNTDRIALSTTNDGVVVISSSTGAVVYQTDDPKRAVLRVDLSQDGSTLMVMSDGLRVYDVDKKSEIASFSYSYPQALSPSGRRVVGRLGQDHDLNVIDITKGIILGKIPFLSNPQPMCVSFRGEDALVVGVKGGGIVHLALEGTRAADEYLRGPESDHSRRLREAFAKNLCNRHADPKDRQRGLRELRARWPEELSRLRQAGQLTLEELPNLEPSYIPNHALLAASLSPEMLLKKLEDHRSAEFSRATQWAAALAYWDPTVLDSIESALRIKLTERELLANAYPLAGSTVERAHAAVLATKVSWAREQGLSSTPFRDLWSRVARTVLAAGGSLGPHLSMYLQHGLGTTLDLANELIGIIEDPHATVEVRMVARKAMALQFERMGTPSASDPVKPSLDRANEMVATLANDASISSEERQLALDTLYQVDPAGVEVVLAKRKGRAVGFPEWQSVVKITAEERLALSKQVPWSSLEAALKDHQREDYAAVALVLVPQLMQWFPTVRDQLEPIVRPWLGDTRSCANDEGKSIALSRLAVEAYRALCRQKVPELPWWPSGVIIAQRLALEAGETENPLDPDLPRGWPSKSEDVTTALAKIAEDSTRPGLIRLQALRWGGATQQAARGLVADSQLAEETRALAINYLRTEPENIEVVTGICIDRTQPVGIRLRLLHWLCANQNTTEIHELCRSIASEAGESLTLRRAAANVIGSVTPDRCAELRAKGVFPAKEIQSCESHYHAQDGYHGSYITGLGQTPLPILKPGEIDPEELMTILRGGNDIARVITGLRALPSVSQWAPNPTADGLDLAVRYLLSDLSFVTKLPGRYHSFEDRVAEHAYAACRALIRSKIAEDRTNLIHAIAQMALYDPRGPVGLFQYAIVMTGEVQADDLPEQERGLRAILDRVLEEILSNTRPTEQRRGLFELLNRFRMEGPMKSLHDDYRIKAHKALSAQCRAGELDDITAQWVRGTLGLW